MTPSDAAKQTYPNESESDTVDLTLQVPQIKSNPYDDELYEELFAFGNYDFNLVYSFKVIP